MTVDDGAGAVRILIADCDPRVRAALRSLLSASPGFDVVGDAGNAATALELARRHAPGIAIVEVELPSATEGLGLLRAITNELHIPALAMSMHGGLRSQALTAGAYSFLEKDCTPSLLLMILLAAARP